MQTAGSITDAVRVSSGASYAPGCVIDGRMNWARLCARMSGQRLVRRRTTQDEDALPPDPGDYAVPESVRNTYAGDVYAALLAIADGDGIFPTVDELATRAGFFRADAYDLCKAALIDLQRSGLIAQRQWYSRRVLRIVATGQILRTRGCPDSEMV